MGSNKRVKNISNGNMDQAGADEDMGEYIGDTMPRPIKNDFNIPEKPVTMELDAGVAVLVMSEKIFKELFPHARLCQSQLVLKNYTARVIEGGCALTAVDVPMEHVC